MMEPTPLMDAISIVVIYGCMLALAAIITNTLYDSFRYTRLYDKLMAFFSRS